MRISLILGCVFLCLLGNQLKVSAMDQDQYPAGADSLIRKNVDINNRIATHFMEKEPNLAFYYADSSAIKALEIHYLEGLSTALIIKGKVSIMLGNYERAFIYFDKVNNISYALEDTINMIDSHIDLATVFLKMNDLEAAEKQYQQAIAFPGIEKYPLAYANIYTGLWQVYWKRKDNDTTLYFQKKALDIYNIHKDDEKLSREIANGFLNVEDFEQALNFYQLSLDKQRESGDEKAIADDLINIGEIYLSKEMGAEAIEYFIEAQDYYLTIGIKPSLFEVAMNLGASYQYMKEYSTAIVHLEEALEIAKAIGSIEFQARANQLLAEVYEENGYFDESVNFYKRYVALQDSIYGKEAAERTAELKANFQFQQKEKEIALLRKEKEQLNEATLYQEKINNLNANLLLILAVTMVLIILIAILIFYRYKAKKEANKLLSRQFTAISQQKGEIEDKSNIIKKNYEELRLAREIIEVKNQALREANERLEELVDQRTTELKRTYNKLSFHVDNTPLAVLEWNDKMELIRWSSQAEKIFGWKASEVIGKHIQNLPLINKDHKDSIDKIFAELLTGEKPRNFYKNQNYDRNGNLLDVEWSNSILFNEEGRLESILSIANDVTIREKAITDLKHSNNELDNFIYRASHDLRGPITRLVGVVNLGMLEAKEKVSRKYFDILGKVAFEMNAMLSRLLTVHEIYQHKIKVEEINIKSVLKGYVDEFRQKNLTFSVDMTYDIPVKLKWGTDERVFKIAMQNLIENAYVNGIDQQTNIKISVSKINEHFIKVVVSDNGHGFPEKVMDKIFEMFFQGSEKSNVNYGLGLYLAKKSVEKIGGSISITKPVNDTTFEIILPNLQLHPERLKEQTLALKK